ncbi:EamA family transporter RarD [Microbacterium pseudoresistens]|uniref:Chloramphenicol-sensitive protein RarD n=1 Tax=Microbacterium pseudoresistens TaxID=640634 RepID=A0A7Y9JMC8_9MICO|nr:chloramphenicol-sensitive protein RarD [Microbacterium pseudoresistens]
MTTPSRTSPVGVAYGVSAYLLWGLLPIYFLLLVPTGPWELVAWRVLLSFVLCLVLLTVVRGWKPFLAIVRQPRLLGWTALAGAVIYVNWQVFVLAALSDHIVETSLGYFINPIFTVLLGVFVLGERLRPLQWTAVGIAAIAVVVIVVAYGSFPWIALTLAASFGSYGLIKKKIGPAVDALSGLTLESFWLVPVAVVQLVLVAQLGTLTYGTVSTTHTVLLSFAGIATAMPLLLFAASTRRIGLSVVGMLQFITPVMQFITGAFIQGEPMPVERWIGFGIVWVAIAVFLIDLAIAGRRDRRTAQAAAVGAVV